MVRYTSILLPLAKSRKRRLEEAAVARGETLEGFILEAAEAEAERLGDWLAEKGHSVDHQIYSSVGQEGGSREAFHLGGERQVAPHRVAMEMGWDDGNSDWLGDLDLLMENLDRLDRVPTAIPTYSAADDGTNTRRSPRYNVAKLQLLNPVQGTVVDISASGLGIETFRPFSVPEEGLFSIGKAVATAKIRAEVRWCQLVRTERFHNGDVVAIYRSGLAFLGH